MNRANLLEKHFLSRSYEQADKIEELLENRYSNTGGQKPFLIFLAAAQQPEEVLEHKDPIKEKVLSKARKHRTRSELKQYIQKTTDNQKKVVKKIQSHNRKKTSKAFPIQKMLEHYGIPTIEEFVPLNTLWQSYMQDLLFPNGTVPSLTVILPKLSTADFNGSLLTVVQSKNTNLVGIRGIVVCDTQFSFVICTPRCEDSKQWNEERADFSPLEIVGGLRIIQKRGTLFAFDVLLGKDDEECIGFTIIGSRFEFRAVDRSGKKFKNHNVDDLA